VFVHDEFPEQVMECRKVAERSAPKDLLDPRGEPLEHDPALAGRPSTFECQEQPVDGKTVPVEPVVADVRPIVNDLLGDLQPRLR
jgi:hypothetical protein